VKNYQLSVKETGGGHRLPAAKLSPAQADRSYGIEVAKLAGPAERKSSRAPAKCSPSTNRRNEN